MKQAEVVVGCTYQTYIGQTLARVVVLGSYPPGRYEKHMRFRIRREGETKELPKHRTAAALRACVHSGGFHTSELQHAQANGVCAEAYSEIQDTQVRPLYRDEPFCICGSDGGCACGEV